MKWFIRLFLLLGLFLFGESGLYAGFSSLDGNRYPTTNYHPGQSAANLSTTFHSRLSCSYSYPIQLKKEYRKIKGTKEEDDDRKSFRHKKIKGLESNAGKYTLTRPSETLTPGQIISQYCFARKKGTPSSYHFLCAKNYRLYNLFQVFLI